MVAAIGSVAIAFLAPDGRKPFDVVWTLSTAAIHGSLGKGPHIGASALLALAAVIATGRHRLWLAFALSVLVGGCWELGQSTVIGHQARGADLAPDGVGALIGCLWGALVLWLLEPERRSCALPHRAPRRFR